MALSLKHRKFCEEYIRLWNATDAYQAAYPKVNRDTARANGARLLAFASIDEEIKRRVAELTLSPAEVLTLLGQHAKADIGDFLAVAANGDVSLDITAAKGKTYLIKKVTQRHSTRTTKDSVTEDVVLTLELHDAQAALVQIGKHHKLFTDVSETKITGSMELTADERAKATKELDVWNEQQKNSDAMSNG